MIQLSKKDVWWSYLAQFFSIASGLIILPIILHKLSESEIAMNYLMMTVGTMVALLDFGFAPQIGRNITYIFSGAQELKKEGVNVNLSKEINYHLLAIAIRTSKYLYRKLSLIVLIIMLTFGTLYIYRVTDGFNNVQNSLLIWVIYAISIYLQIYFTYYTSLLTGKGLITDSKKAIFYSRLLYIVLSIILLIIFRLGLLGIVISQFISPFLSRYISYKAFYSPELKSQINDQEITEEEIKKFFSLLWFNSKKLGLVFIGGYAITKFSIFISGLFLSLSEIASYGLMTQLVGIISVIAGTLFSISIPRINNLKMELKYDKLIQTFSFSMSVYYLIFILGSVFVIFAVPWFLNIIKSNADLPNLNVLLLYCFIILLENNHSYFSTVIVSGNTVPFVTPSLITGGFIVLGDFLVLRYTSWGILGLVLVQGICQLAYSNWKWPRVVCKEYNISACNFVKIGLKELASKIVHYE